MTKQAVLHDGRVLHFPDDTPDEYVHQQVRSTLGLPPPEPKVDPVVEAHQGTQAALGHAAGVMETARQASERSTQAMSALHQQLGASMGAMAQSHGQLHQHLANLAEAHRAVLSHMANLAENMRGLGEHIVQAHQQTQHAMNDASQRHDQVRQAVEKVGSAISAPKRAVKDKDGNWRSESIVVK